MFGFFKRKTEDSDQKTNPEQRFWNWFQDNQLKIEKFIDSDYRDYSVYNQLTKRVKAYNNFLFPELTKTEDNQYVFIITPDGIKEGIEPTKKLGESHPVLKGWIVKKFRQPTDRITLNIGGLEYPSSDIEIIPEIDYEKDKVDIRVFIRNMNADEKKYQNLAFLYFDHILGEFNTVTKIGYIDFYHLDTDKNIKDGIGLLELRKLIEQELY